MRGQRHAPAALYPRGRPGNHCTGGWVGPRLGVHRCGKSRAPPGFDPRIVQPVASRYTDWATRPTTNIRCQQILIKLPHIKCNNIFSGLVGVARGHCKMTMHNVETVRCVACTLRMLVPGPRQDKPHWLQSRIHISLHIYVKLMIQRNYMIHSCLKVGLNKKSKARSQNCGKRLSVSCLSVSPHRTNLSPVDGVPRNLRFEYFRKSVEKIKVSWIPHKNNGLTYMPTCVRVW